ncbi:MAG TPA: response regulator transcription factor [Candidatus Sumerlaeota bacterium]|nr:response regulator transcription factor [Candidatus Sumerlaeota bacterium]
MRILVIEDERRLARNIGKGIQSIPSFVVDLSHDGEDGEFLALTENYDLIILDLMLPGKDGLSILKTLREQGRVTPVLILTARNAPDDVIRGLDYGSDDYLGKPFDMGELLARVKALIRRSKGRPDPLIHVGNLEINTISHQIKRGGKIIVLPALEYRLLEYLAFHQDEVVSKTVLLEHLYDYNWEKFSNVIEVYIHSLRSKIDRGYEENLIHTFRGQGYMLAKGNKRPNERV